MKAVWNTVTIAESDDTVVVEGNHYFQPDSVQWRYLEQTDHTTVCPWKGTAVYYSIAAHNKRNENAAWSYPDPSEAAKNIKGYIAFYGSVDVS
jgi:uncharacterized protein (DUF427 family)